MSRSGAVQVSTVDEDHQDVVVDQPARGEFDYDVNRRAAAEIQGLAQKLNVVLDKMDDIDETLRDGRSAPAN